MAAERLLPPQREAGDLVAAWAGKTAGRATATTPLRWWALVVFVTMSAVQNAVWISFSVLIPEACAFFRVSTASINFLATLGPLVLIPVAFVTGPLSRSLGLTNCGRRQGTLGLTAAGLLLVPAASMRKALDVGGQ